MRVIGKGATSPEVLDVLTRHYSAFRTPHACGRITVRFPQRSMKYEENRQSHSFAGNKALATINVKLSATFKAGRLHLHDCRPISTTWLSGAHALEG
jgi:hypothetical protein